MSVVTDAAAVPVAQVNPVAKLAAAFTIAVGLVLSVDWVSASTALALEVILLAAMRVPLRSLLNRGAILVFAAALTAVTITLYGEPSGTVHWHFLLITVSDGSITLAVATFLRVLAIALPAVFLFIDTDPTELADGLGQVLRLPARFVLGALAGVRMIGLLGQDWRYLGYARRARVSPTTPASGGQRGRRSRCWSSRSAADRCSPQRWRRAGSAPTPPGRGRGPHPSAAARSR